MRLATFLSVLLSWGFRLPLLLVLLAATGHVGQAQGIMGFGPEVQEALQRAQRNTLENSIGGDALPLEGALDPDSYTVGPGDVFAITIGTALPTDLSATVSADGLLLVPGVGSFDVAGASLAEARALVIAGIRGSFRNVNAEIALERPRRFYVHIAGAVPQPGRHAVAPIARVEDALATAMGEASPIIVIQELRRSAGYTEEPPFLPALRSIEIRHRDGTTETVDLWRYYTSGDLSFNPYVRDGDALHIPAFRDDLSAVTVEGEVANAGSYDFREGDTALDLLTIAAGTEDIHSLGEVRLVRRGMDRATTLNPAVLATGAENPALRPGDRLLVMPKDLAEGVASVVGHVEYPGSYPIRTGETTLRDLVEMAGGLRPSALLRGAYLERRGTSRRMRFNPDQPTPLRSLPLQVGANPEAIEFLLESEISALARYSDLGFSGQQFYGRELLQPQRVSVDVATALTEPAAPVYLRDGDRLVIPRDPQAVLVVGQVERPGFVTFEPGLSPEGYIRRAGGRGTASAEVYVRDARTGRISLAGDEPLGSGDYVFVDRIGVGSTSELQALVLQERSLEQQREQASGQRRLQYYQVGLSVVSTVAAFITTYLAITRE